MSNLISNVNKENSTRINSIDDSSNVNDATNTGEDTSSFKCISSRNTRNFFAYPGLNQHFRTCLRKTRQGSVISSQPDGTYPRTAKNPVVRDNDAEKARDVMRGEKNVKMFAKYSLLKQKHPKSVS